MEHFVNEEKVKDYLLIESKSSILPERLKRFLYRGQSILEIGMGNGKDFDRLSQWYSVTGSDYSPHLLDNYLQHNPQADLLELDVRDLPLGSLYDAVFTNKVLPLFSPEELILIFQSMHRLIHPGGVMLHSFWLGEKEEEFENTALYYYTERLVEELLGPGFKVLESDRYSDQGEQDSFYIIVRAQPVPSRGLSSLSD